MDTVLDFTVTDNEAQLIEEGWTEGEIILGKRLKANTYLQGIGRLKDREVQTVWAQVNLRGGDKRVDFLVFTPSLVYVIEVKDYQDLNVGKAKPWERTVKNCYVQCDEYVKEIEQITRKALPVVGIVAFPNVDSNHPLAPEVKLQGNKKYNIDTWFAKQVRSKHLRKQLEQSSAHINRIKKDSIRQMLCAMARIIPNLLTKEMECNDDLPLHVYDKTQINMSHDFTRTGDRIIYGVAGSGKTAIIVNRAKQLVRLHPEFRILVLSYNKPLNIFLENQLRGTGIEVKTIHAWYRSILQRWDPKYHNDLLNQYKTKGNQVESRYFDMLPKAVDEGIHESKLLSQYDAILVDEGQDFKQLWYKHLKMAYNETKSSLFLVCLDSLQAIHHQDNGFNWSSVGIAARGRTLYLRKNYRNRSKIGEYAISKLKNVANDSRDEDMRQYLEIEELPRKGGVVIEKVCNFSDAFVFMANHIKQLSKNESCMIVYDKIPAPFRLKGLRKYGIENRKVWGPKETKEDKIMPNRFNVPIFSVYRSKGLETDVVIFIHPENDKNQEINYVAITRAMEKIIDLSITDI